MAGENDATKEWGVFGARDLVPSDITYELRINSRIVQGEKTGAGARQEGGTAEGSVDISREAQGEGGSG